jgi:riboflavin transporter FmnP
MTVKSEYSYTRTVAGAALFGSLSFVTSALTTRYVPRLHVWGIALIDPVSIVWIMCFLIFGLRAGLLCSVIGTFGLMFFDPFAPIGPLMKFVATLPLMITFYVGLRMKHSMPQGEHLKSLKNYVPLSIAGTISRIAIMTLANILFFTYVISINYAQFKLGNVVITSWSAVILGAILVNAEQSVWDCLIPYITVFSTKIYDRFRLW